MPPNRIIFIRHGEKPDQDKGIFGVDPTGAADKHSLSVRGWQRAGAIAQYFGPNCGDETRIPHAIFSSGVTADSHSRRENQTVEPLVQLLLHSAAVSYKDGYEETDYAGLIKDVMASDGVALVCWHHNKIRKIIAAVPDAPHLSLDWPDDRFDMMWVLEPDAAGKWAFSQFPLCLLSGDRAD